MKIWRFALLACLLASPALAQQPVVVYSGGVGVDPRSIRVLTTTDQVTVFQPTGSNLHVVVDTAPTTAVTGTFWQATQPVSGTFWQATQPISAASLPLPTGAAADSSLTTLDTDLKANVTLHAGTNVIGHVIADSGSTTAVTQATAGNLNATVVGTGTFATQSAQSGTWTVQPGNTANTTSWLVDAHLWNGAALASPDANSYPIVAPAATATANAAALDCNVLSAASTNATNCKNAAGNLYGYELYNTTTTVYYLRLYNLSSAPTCSSATGFIRSIPIPPASTAGLVGGAINPTSLGVNYGTGIGYCLTGGSSSTDNTNAATGIFGVLKYK